MGSKFGKIVKDISSLKNSTISPSKVLTIATDAVGKAKVFSTEEMKLLKVKISKIEEKTSAEFEKIVYLMVDKLLKDKSQEDVSEEVKNEIVRKLTKYNNGKNIYPIFKYVNNTILNNVPKSINSLKSFKKNVVNTLICDANLRLERKKVASN